jgi:hypothetical protein
MPEQIGNRAAISEADDAPVVQPGRNPQGSRRCTIITALHARRLARLRPSVDLVESHVWREGNRRAGAEGGGAHGAHGRELLAPTVNLRPRRRDEPT